jgi:adenosylcobinamide-GDP ribazoletransferase
VIAALNFLTVIGRGRVPSRSMTRWFGAVGVLIGAGVAGAWKLGDTWWSPLVAGVFAVVAEATLTGMLHFDGLADTADGLLPHLDQTRRLEVMAAPDVGAFGVVTVVLTVSLMTASLATTPLDRVSLWTVVALWGVARVVMVIGLCVFRPARPNGLAALMSSEGPSAIVFSAIPPIGAVVASGSARGAVVCAIGLLAGVGVLLLARRRIGGVTGDVLGAAGVLAEVTGLLVLARR